VRAAHAGSTLAVWIRAKDGLSLIIALRSRRRTVRNNRSQRRNGCRIRPWCRWPQRSLRPTSLRCPISYPQACSGKNCDVGLAAAEKQAGGSSKARPPHQRASGREDRLPHVLIGGWPSADVSSSRSRLTDGKVGFRKRACGLRRQEAMATRAQRASIFPFVLEHSGIASRCTGSRGLERPRPAPVYYPVCYRANDTE